MMLVIIAAVILPLVVVTFFALSHGAPLVNRLLGFIWQDPSERQRKVILRRVHELTVQDKVPEATALMLAAKELHSNEDEALRIARAIDPGDLVRMATGTRSGLGSWLGVIHKLFGAK